MVAALDVVRMGTMSINQVRPLPARHSRLGRQTAGGLAAPARPNHN